MTCGRYERWIALAAGGDLQPRRMRRLERHLAGCGRCREYAAAMSRACEVFQELASEPAGSAELAAVRAAVMARVAGERSGHAFAWRWALAPIAAVTALMIVFWVRAPEVTPPGVGRETPPTAPSGRGSAGLRQDRNEADETASTVRRFGGAGSQPAPGSQPGSAPISTTSRRPEMPPSESGPHGRGLVVRAAGATTGSRADEGVRPTSLRRIEAIPPREPDGDIVVRLETNDPNVVIYWVMQSGESE